MGINYNFKTLPSLHKYQNQKTGFYNSLLVFGEQQTSWSSDTSMYLLGEHAKFNIINPEIQVELLKRIKNFFYEISKKEGKMFYVNEPTNNRFDGIIKFFAYKAGQVFLTGKWPCGLITKNKSLHIKSILLFNPIKSAFPIKEANKLGIPIISLNMNISKTMYQIIVNNLEGNSIFFSTLVFSHSILEGKLFAFIKKKHLNNF